MNRKQFTFYRSFYEAVQLLPEELRLGLITAIIEYALDGKPPDGLSAVQMSNFVLVKPNLDAAWEKAKAGAIGGKTSKRSSSKISKGEKENKKEKKKEKKKETETEIKAEGFPAFWERYPLKVGREAAEAEWACVSDEKEDILFGLEGWIASKQWQVENGRFIPKAEKWLRERWWHQKPSQGIPKGASGRLGQAEMESIQRMLKEV